MRDDKTNPAFSGGEYSFEREWSGAGRIRLRASGTSGVMLETERLLIREVVAADSDRFDTFMCARNYWRDLPIDPPTPRSVKAFIDCCVLDQAREPRTSYFLAATDKLTGCIVGQATLVVHSEAWHQGEFGWAVDPRRVGAGLATEIARAMLTFAFDNLELHRVYAQCRVGNEASRRIMEKLGMREEGLLRENVFARGEWWSSLQASILAEEWRSAALIS